MAWAYGGISDTVEFCGKTRLTLHYPESRLFTNPPPKLCNGWGCPACAVRRATEELQIFAQAVALEEQVWVARCSFDEGLPERIRTRSTRAVKRVGPLGRALFTRADTWPAEHPNRAFIVATVDLSQSAEDEPTEGVWMTPTDAVALVANEALALPGVLRAPVFAGTWKREGAPRPSTDGRFIGMGHEERIRTMWELAAKESERDWGEVLEPGVPYSENLPSEEAEKIMRRNHNAARPKKKT
jgi:hypothetical protein